MQKEMVKIMKKKLKLKNELVELALYQGTVLALFGNMSEPPKDLLPQDVVIAPLRIDGRWWSRFDELMIQPAQSTSGEKYQRLKRYQYGHSPFHGQVVTEMKQATSSRLRGQAVLVYGKTPYMDYYFQNIIWEFYSSPDDIYLGLYNALRIAEEKAPDGDVPQVLIIWHGGPQTNVPEKLSSSQSRAPSPVDYTKWQVQAIRDFSHLAVRDIRLNILVPNGQITAFTDWPNLFWQVAEEENLFAFDPKKKNDTLLPT